MRAVDSLVQHWPSAKCSQSSPDRGDEARLETGVEWRLPPRHRARDAIFLGEDPTRPVSSPRVKRPVLAFRWLLLLSLSSLSNVVGCADESAPITGLTFDACAPLDIGIAPALTAEQMQGVTDALAMWNQAAGTALAPMTTDAGPGSTAFSTSTPMVPLTFQVAAPPFHGLYDDRAGRIYVNADLTDEIGRAHV